MNEKLDEVGPWSEVKLEITKGYLQAFSTIMAAQKIDFKHIYVDAFAGAGEHIAKQSRQIIPGSPQNALEVVPPFVEYHFVEQDPVRVQRLEVLAARYPERKVLIHPGDCNQVLVSDVFPRIKYERFERALCFVDPYGMNLSWEIMKIAGQSRAMEVVLNFPVMDMNRNALWRKPEMVAADQLDRMNYFWGDSSWQDEMYTPSAQQSLFGEPILDKLDNEALVAAYCKRLRKIAGFKYAVKPLAMKNSTGATLYYLVFATQNDTGRRIMSSLFKKFGT